MSRWDRRPAPCLDFLSLWSLEVAHLAGLEVVKLDPDTEGDVGEVGGGRVEEGGAGGGLVPKLAAGIGILTDIRLRWYRYNYVLMQFFGPRSCSNPTSGKWAHEGKILEGGGRGGAGGTAYHHHQHHHQHHHHCQLWNNWIGSPSPNTCFAISHELKSALIFLFS